MDEIGFASYLTANGRLPNTVKRCVALVQEFERYLLGHKQGRELEQADPQDLADFAAWASGRVRCVDTYLLAVAVYYDCAGRPQMSAAARALRRPRPRQAALHLAEIQGVPPEHVERLAAEGIRTTEHMLAAGRRPRQRQVLAERTGIPQEVVLELVKLSDLARVPRVKGVRARLCYAIGVDSIEKLQQRAPQEIHALMSDFIARNRLEVKPLSPLEARHIVASARGLSQLIEY